MEGEELGGAFVSLPSPEREREREREKLQNEGIGNYIIQTFHVAVYVRNLHTWFFVPFFTHPRKPANARTGLN